MSTKADLTVRCTITPAEAHCATAVKSQSQADASLPCIVNFTLSTLCVHSVSSSSTKVPSRNRTTSLTAIHVLSNCLGSKKKYFPHKNFRVAYIASHQYKQHDLSAHKRSSHFFEVLFLVCGLRRGKDWLL